MARIMEQTITATVPDLDDLREFFPHYVNYAQQDGKNIIDAESLEREAVEVLIVCTKDWKGIGEAGADLPCTPENVRRVYSTYLWLREQVDEFVEDRGNFMKD